MNSIISEICKQDSIDSVFQPRNGSRHSYDEFMADPMEYIGANPVADLYDDLPEETIVELVEFGSDSIRSSITQAIESLIESGKLVKND